MRQRRGIPPICWDGAAGVFSTLYASSLAVLEGLLIWFRSHRKASQLGKRRLQALPVMVAGDLGFGLGEQPGADFGVAASGGQKHPTENDLAASIDLAGFGPKAREVGFSLRYFLFDGQRHRVFLSAMKGSIMPVNAVCWNPERVAKGALTT